MKGTALWSAVGHWNTGRATGKASAAPWGGGRTARWPETEQEPQVSCQKAPGCLPCVPLPRPVVPVRTMENMLNKCKEERKRLLNSLPELNLSDIWKEQKRKKSHFLREKIPKVLHPFKNSYNPRGITHLSWREGVCEMGLGYTLL